MRTRGYALAELLVAVAIAGLIVTTLMFVNVDYVGFARRVVDIQGPFAMGRRVEASSNLDRCADPGATLTAGQNQVVAQDKKQASPVLTLSVNGETSELVTPQGLAGKSNRPVRIVVQSAPAPGGSMASIEVGDATVGVIATRCDLAELCDYDATNAACREPDTNAAEDATNATNAAPGETRLPDTAEFVEAAEGAIVGDEIPDEIFVRAIDLPTLSLRQARAAVAQQIDILSPLPPAEVASCVVLVGPVEEGLNRFAVGFAPKRLLARVAAPDERTVTLTGWLDGEAIAFRFERPGAAPGKPDWGARLEVATIAGACLAILLAAASLRLDREIERAQVRLDAANTQVQRLSRDAAALARVGGAWRAAQSTRPAAVVDCALTGLAKAAGGPVTISKITLANGQVSARLSAPISDATLTALRALGFSAATSAAPVSATAPSPSPPAAIQDVQTNAADCR